MGEARKALLITRVMLASANESFHPLNSLIVPEELNAQPLLCPADPPLFYHSHHSQQAKHPEQAACSCYVIIYFFRLKYYCYDLHCLIKIYSNFHIQILCLLFSNTLILFIFSR